MSVGICDFRKNRFIEGHTFLMGVTKTTFKPVPCNRMTL